MPNWGEIFTFWTVLKANLLSFWGGILGLIFTTIWIFWEKAPMKRVFLTFFVVIAFLSLGLVWLDEYRAHQTDRNIWALLKKELEDKINSKPKVEYRTIPDPDAAHLRAELDQRRIRRANRERISLVLNAGVKLRDYCNSTEERPDCLKQAEDWNSGVYTMLSQMGTSYASRLAASTGLMFSYSGVPKTQQNVINFLNPRIQTLSQLLGELRD